MIENPKKQFWTVDDGKLNIYPHPGQARTLASEKRFVMMIAGAQGGKTATGPVWLYREMQRRGPGDYLCVTPTYTLLEMSMLVKFREFFEDALCLGSYKEQKHHFLLSDYGKKTVFGEETSTPTRIIFGTAQSPGSLEAATAKGCWCDELGQDQFGVASWEAILRRCSLHRARILGTTTPYSIGGWFRKRIYDRWLDGDQNIDVIQFASNMNPIFTDEEFEDRKRDMAQWRFDLFYGGQFSKPTSLIYQDFIDRYEVDGGHKVEPFHIPYGWERFTGVDFGSVVTAVIWLAFDPKEETFYVYRLKTMGRMATQEYVNTTLSESRHEPMSSNYGGAPGEMQFRQDWSNEGFYISEPPIIDVECGIDRIVSLLRGYKIFFFVTLTDLFAELNTYSRETDDEGEPTEKIHDKGSYHRLDSLRYAVVGAFNPRRAEVASEDIAAYFGFATKGLGSFL